MALQPLPGRTSSPPPGTRRLPRPPSDCTGRGAAGRSPGDGALQENRTVIPAAASTVIDDVTVLRGPSAAPGRHAAGLVFRVGQFDETLPERGITHMVEHLTFGGHHEAAYNFNASVDGRYTQFIVESSDPAGIA